MAGGVRGAGAKPPSQEAYFVALGGILVLLLLLCCYFFYFCIKRVKGTIQLDYARAQRRRVKTVEEYVRLSEEQLVLYKVEKKAVVVVVVRKVC